MKPYNILIVFKNNKSMAFKVQAEKNPREEFEKHWVEYKNDEAVAIGDYIIDIKEILYIKVEGDPSLSYKKKPIRKKGKK